MKTTRAITFALALLLPRASSSAQDASRTSAAAERATVSFDEYLARVGRNHIESLAVRAALPVAVAQISVARIFPSPLLTFGVGSVDLSGRHQPTASFLGLSVPVTFGGKRRHRIEVAEAERDVIDADIAAYLLTLRAEAAIAYVDALEARLILERQQRTHASLGRLVEVNAHRFEHGDIGETVLLQSQVEAESFRARLFASEGKLRGAEMVLAIYASESADSPEPIAVEGTLGLPLRTFDEAELLARALENRPDLRARMRAVERAREELGLAYANRVIDAQVNLGWMHNGNSPANTDFTQRHNEIGQLTLSIPIPFANAYRGTLRAAEATIRQETLQRSATELRVRTEVRRALAEYVAAAERIEVYGTGLLARADQVLERVMYEYQHGGTTLIEVLVAQRTANQVHLDYFEALAAHARALIRLETAGGFWDVRFSP